MVSKWKEVMLKDVVSILGDGLHGTPKYSEDGEYYFINGNNLDNGRIIFRENTKRVDHDQYLKYKKELNDRTLLVSINGTIGNIAYYNGEKVVLGKSACYFNLIDSIEKRYVRYVLSSHYFKNYLYSFATGTTIKNISLKSMREFKFKLPPLPEQKAIAHILGTLDDKIGTNRQMNETLEAMAQALFKSWFVDFDPVIDNALLAGNAIPEPLKERAEMRQAQLDSGKANTNTEINDLFPKKFEFTEELGWIPKGWSIGKFSDLAKLNPQSWTKKNIPDEILYVDLGNTNNGKIDSVTPYLSSDAPSRAKRVLAVDDTIIGTVRPGNRSFAYIHSEGLTGSTGFAVMRPLELHNRSYIYLGLTQDKVIDYFSNMAGGSAYPAINSSVVADLKCVIAPATILDYFDNKAYTFINTIGVNNNLNETLVKLRDTLLPKLMSGELRIADAEKLVQYAL